MEFGRVWKPGECLPIGLQTASLKVVGDYLPPILIRPQNSPDPDYERPESIMERLKVDEATFTPSPLVNINCECLIQPSLTKKQENLYSSKHFSDSDSDDEDTNIAMIVKMLNGLCNRVMSTNSYKTLISVLDGYICKENITEEQLNGIFPLLKHDNTGIREVTLKFFSKLCTLTTNAAILLEKELLDYLHSKVSTPTHQLMVPSLQVLQGILSHKELIDKWIEPVTCQFLSPLLSYLNKKELTLDSKYSICCVLRELVQYTEFIEVTQKQIIPAVSMIKDRSGKLREVYTEILTRLLLHTDYLPPDIVDSGIVPSTVCMIRDGPCGTQVQALKLLAGLTETESGIPSVIENTYAVPYIICCLKESKCRKVKREALKCLIHVTRSRRLGLCKEFMVQAATYLNPTDSHSYSQLLRCSSSLGNRVKSPVRGRHVEKDSVLWKGLHRMVKIIGKLIARESLAETDKKGKVTLVGYKPCIDMCPVRVISLTRCVLVLQNVCLWPALKDKHHVNQIDLKHFTDSDHQRSKLSKLNRNLTQRVWDTTGLTVLQLLATFSEKLTSVQQIAKQYQETKENLCSHHAEGEGDISNEKRFTSQESIIKMVDEKGHVDLSGVLEQEELDLVRSILELILCLVLCSCKDFQDMTSKKKKSPNHNSRKERGPRPDSSMGRPPLPRKLTRPSSAHHTRLSPPEKDEDHCWVKENPHLTNTLDRSSTPCESISKTDVGRFHEELIRKEAAAERRIIRKCLYEADTIKTVAAFLQCKQPDLQILSCQILRCCIQPLEEKVYPQAAPPQTKQRIRPHSAVGPREADHKIKVAFHYMSPEIASLIRDALGPDFHEVAKVPDDPVKIDEPKVTDSEAVDRLNSYMKSKQPIIPQPKRIPSPKPVINICQPIASQCRECLLQHAGPSIVTGIFAESKELRKCHVLLLQDLVHLGDVETHMTLSKFGCMQRLLDFIRMNKDDELLEIIGLIIIQMLVTSDDRIKQVFNRYGGNRLLTTMAGFTTGLLREEVAKTLHTVSTSKAPTRKLGRPSSAPLSGTRSGNQSAPDVWDDIQGRWQVEDKISDLLGSWKK